MSWNFHEITRVGAESALDACDYFVDEVIEPWKVLGAENGSFQVENQLDLRKIDESSGNIFFNFLFFSP